MGISSRVFDNSVMAGEDKGRCLRRVCEMAGKRRTSGDPIRPGFRNGLKNRTENRSGCQSRCGFDRDEKHLNLDFDLADRVRAAGQNVPRVDVVFRDPSVVYHMDLAGSFLDLAGPAYAEGTA